MVLILAFLQKIKPNAKFVLTRQVKQKGSRRPLYKFAYKQKGGEVFPSNRFLKKQFAFLECLFVSCSTRGIRVALEGPLRFHNLY